MIYLCAPDCTTVRALKAQGIDTHSLPAATTTILPDVDATDRFTGTEDRRWQSGLSSGAKMFRQLTTLHCDRTPNVELRLATVITQHTFSVLCLCLCLLLPLFKSVVLGPGKMAIDGQSDSHLGLQHSWHSHSVLTRFDLIPSQ